MERSTVVPQRSATATGTIGVVIAAYDEVEGLRRLLPQLSELTVVVSSDGSTDGTPEVAAGHGALVLHSPSNRGKSAALRDGCRAALDAGCDVLVLLDGDGQHRPSELWRLVDPILGGEADLVLGSRYLENGGRGTAPRNRYVVRTLTGRLLGRVFGYPVTDPYCGYRALSREAATRLGFGGTRYQCELEMLFDAEVADLRVAEVPVTKVYGTGMTKMGADHGRFVGRLSVLAQYGRAMTRGLRRLRNARKPGEA